MTDSIPERGGAVDFRGRLAPDYSPNHDGDPDPGEVVWAWVPFEEDHTQGKDRPLIVIGRAVGNDELLVCLMLSSKDHDDDRNWHPVGTGNWDSEHRPSWARIDRPLAVTDQAMRREGGVLDKATFLELVEHTVRGPGSIATPAGSTKAGQPKPTPTKPSTPSTPPASSTPTSWFGKLWNRLRAK
jgi:mRNA-degrading endonuclease toxin of MazEF toxin-antitoxin module